MYVLSSILFIQMNKYLQLYISIKLSLKITEKNVLYISLVLNPVPADILSFIYKKVLVFKGK